MNVIKHEDLMKLHQYHISLHHELARFEADFPEFKNGSKISTLSRKIVEISTDIADKRITGGAKVSEPISKDSVIWLLFANMILLIAMTAFIVSLNSKVLTLESKVFPSGRLWAEEAK